MYDFICKKCGEIQKPQTEGNNFNTFGITCQKCGGELIIRMRKQERGKNVNKCQTQNTNQNTSD